MTPPILVVGYLLAVFVRSEPARLDALSHLFFLPFIIGLTTLSSCYVELQPGFGTINVILSHLGIEGINTPWTADTNLALTAICIFVIWFASGLTMMLLMAGMQSIPEQLYESADVDGASWWQQERMITIPLLRRSIALSLVISVVGSLLAFNQFFIITDGGPGSSTQSVVMQITRPSTPRSTSARRARCRSSSCRRRLHHLRPAPLPAQRRCLSERSARRRRGAHASRPGPRSTSSLGCVISAIFVAPLLWEVLRSFQAPGAIIERPSLKSFEHLGIHNYTQLLSGDHILHNVVNSLIVATSTAILTAVVATLAGYGFGRFKFRFSGFAFALVLLAFLVPFQAVLTKPLFLELHDFGLLNSLVGLALFYTAFNLPFGTYLMRNTFLQIPTRSPTRPR